MMDPEAEPVDALDSVSVQDHAVAAVLEDWARTGAELEHNGDVDVRWRRGSDVKLLLEHLAVREEALRHVVRRLERLGSSDRAAELDGDGVHRRALIAELDERVRGVLPLGTIRPEVDATVTELRNVLDAELTSHRTLLPALEELLGRQGERGLPSAGYVRANAVTHVNPKPAWYDKIGPLHAVRALFDHLRGHPDANLAPSVDKFRNHVPGVGHRASGSPDR
jgi:hypothetical protein